MKTSSIFKFLSLFFLMLLAVQLATAQKLQPGFEKQELLDMLHLSAQQWDSSMHVSSIVSPSGYTRIYRSPVCGMDNRWDLWMRDDSVAVISIRGSTTEAVSWLQDFYAGMTHANGQLQLNDSTSYPYSMSSDPRAMVHVGFLTGSCFLAQTIMPKVDSLYQSGVRDILITGHSQGGAIATMITAMLNMKIATGELPSDMFIKTYSSASPKPGNLYFSYDYAMKTGNNRAFNIVNPKDWVPQMPVSIQKVSDFSRINPFTSVKKVSKQQTWIVGLAMRKGLRYLERPVNRSERRLRKNLGKRMGYFVEDELDGYEAANYTESMHYCQAGLQYILPVSPAYDREFVHDEDRIFLHHFMEPYIWLAERIELRAGS